MSILCIMCPVHAVSRGGANEPIPHTHPLHPPTQAPMPCYAPSSLNSLDGDAHLHVAFVRVGDERADAGEVHGGAVLVALRGEAPCG